MSLLATFFLLISCNLPIIPDDSLPEASFSIPGQTLYQGCEIFFQNNAPASLQFHWDFGDGNTSTEKEPTHIYTAAGNYNVELTVTNGVISDDTTVVVTVIQQPKFDLKFGDYDLANTGASIIIDRDGNFVLVGDATDISNGWNRSIYLAKFAPDGNFIQKKYISSAGSPLGFSIIQTNDGRYVIVGLVAESNGSGYTDMYLLITDPNFDVLKVKTFGGSFSDAGHSAVEAPNGDLYIAGSKGTGEFTRKTWLVRTNSSGSFEKEYLYEKNDLSGRNSIIITQNGNLAIAATIDNFNNGSSSDIYLMEVGMDGSVKSKNIYNEFQNGDTANDLVQTSDGGYAITGYTFTSSTGGPDGFLIKADSDGKLITAENYGGDGSNYLNAIQEMHNGNLVMTGSTYSSNNGQVFLVITNSNGQTQKTKTYGGNLNDWAQDIVVTMDCGLAFIGTSDASPSSCCPRFYFFKTDSEGN